MAKKKRNKLITLKLSETEMKAIKKYAKEYTDGNVSRWIRYRSITTMS